MFFLFEALVFTLVPLALFHFSWNIQRLRKIPGPFLASVTDLWRSYWMRKGEYTLFVDQLHKKYGKLVRLGPNYVIVSDATAVSTIYGTNPVWTKGDSYKVLIGMKDGKEIPSVVSTIDENRHTVMKRGIGHAFTVNSLLDYEHYIDESAAELFNVFRKQRSCNMSHWFQLFTMDVLSRIAFSESLGFVTHGGDIENTMGSIKTRFEYWNDWMALPGLERLIYRNPIMTRLKASSSAMAVMAAKKLYARKAATQAPPQRDLLQKYIEASEKHPEWVNTSSIIGLTMSTIAAGADTTAVTLTSIMYYLLKNPYVHDKLLAEFQTAIRDGALSNPPRWSEVHKFSYLDVIIKESMRCYPILGFGMDRIVPDGGAEIAGTFIPGGTVVACSQLNVHMDKDVYGQDAEQFRPERWLEADELQRRKMERGFLGFSTGKRICLGLHIAQLEMKKIIPHMMMNFKLTLDDPGMDIGSEGSAVRYPHPVWITFEDRAQN